MSKELDDFKARVWEVAQRIKLLHNHRHRYIIESILIELDVTEPRLADPFKIGTIVRFEQSSLELAMKDNGGMWHWIYFRDGWTIGQGTWEDFLNALRGKHGNIALPDIINDKFCVIAGGRVNV